MNKSGRIQLVALWMLAAALSGCAVGPDYHMPRLSLPSGWMNLGGPTRAGNAPVGNMAWWEAYNDPVLDKLVETAVLNNTDLKLALGRLNEARANRLSATAALLPEIDATAAASRGNQATATPRTTRSALLDASWEVDLFGGNRRAAESARARAASAAAALRSVRVSLLAEVVSEYLDLRQLQQQVDITRRNLSAQKETLRIVTAQYNEGIASGLDLSRAQAQAGTTAAQFPLAEQNMTVRMNALGVLVGLQPQQIAALVLDPRPVPIVSGSVVVDTPASVIASRPDVQSAERDLAAAVADQGVAIANWFPRVSLTGLFGVVDSQLTGGRTAWDAGASLAMPLIDFGRVRALVRTANARQEQALASYEQSVRAALADVETGLSAYLKALARAQELRAANMASQKAVALAEAQYKEGAVPLLDVLVAQQQALTVEGSLAAAEAAVGQAQASLYKAIGGGATAGAAAKQG